MRYLFFFILALSCRGVLAQHFHFSLEPLYYFAGAPNLAVDIKVFDSLTAGIQYSAIDGGQHGRNLSGIQVFYSPSSKIFEGSQVIKFYLGRLSPETKLLGIQSRESGEALAELLYGYRWVWPNAFTASVQAGVFFTKSKLYPSVSLPMGYFF